MVMITKGVVVLDNVLSPLGSPATIICAGPGRGQQSGKTLFTVIIDGMSYGEFLLPGDIATLDEARCRLLTAAGKGSSATVAECAVGYCYLHVDDNDFYGEGS